MNQRILITPRAIQRLSPCESRWRHYRTRTTTGGLDQPHPLGDLCRDGMDGTDLLWLLRHLPENPLLAQVRYRMAREWIASRRPGRCVSKWGRDLSFDMGLDSWCHNCLPLDWAAIARGVLRGLEASR